MAEPGELFRFERPATKTPALSSEVRDNFTALGQTNLSSDPDVPDSTQRRDGMMRVLNEDPNNVKLQMFYDTNWRTLFQQLQLGYPAPAKIITKVDSPGLAVWQIDHNLGSQPIVQVFDLTWRQLQAVPLAPGVDQYILQHSTENRVIITHPAAQDGYAVVVG